MIQPTPFRFYTERRLVTLTGLQVCTLAELLAILHEVPGSSIFYHTHHLFLSHHFEKPVVYNEFALWLSEALQENALAEKIAMIDLRAFTSIRQLRNTLISFIQTHMDSANQRPRVCLPGSEFHFCRSKSFVFPTSIVAHDVADFFSKLPRLQTFRCSFIFSRLAFGSNAGRTTFPFGWSRVDKANSPRPSICSIPMPALLMS